MKKILMYTTLSFALLSGCGEDSESGLTVAPECAWTGDCPTGWKKSGNACKYTAGPTAVLEGNVLVYSLNTVVSGAVVKVLNFDQALPACGVSDATGLVRIEGIPVGTDVTLSAWAGDSYLGNPTYAFHFTRDPIDADSTGNTVYQINNRIAQIFLASLQLTSLASGTGVVAGALFQADGTTRIEGATVKADPAGSSRAYYLAGVMPHPDATKTDKSGTFIFANMSAGKSTITGFNASGGSIGASTAVVYDQTISLANVYAK